MYNNPKRKTLFPVLATATTLVTTIGFVASCSQTTKVRMVDVEDLFTNGWTRETTIHDTETLPHNTNLTNWYLDKVNQNKAILRDDVMIDAFPKPKGLENAEHPAKGSIGLEIGNLILDSQQNNYRVDFNVGFNGTATELEVPEIPGVIEKGYLTGDLSVLIKVTKIKVNVQKLGLFSIYADYFKNLSGVPYAEASLDKIIADHEWNVSMDVKWNGGISPTKGVEPEKVDHGTKTYAFNWQWVISKRPRSEEALQTLANWILPQAYRSLGYMQNVTVSPN